MCKAQKANIDAFVRPKRASLSALLVWGDVHQSLGSIHHFRSLCPAFMAARQHFGQQIGHRPAKRQPAHKTKRAAAGTGARSSAQNESGSDCDGENGERFVPDEFVQIPAPPVRGLPGRIDATGCLRRHVG